MHEQYLKKVFYLILFYISFFIFIHLFIIIFFFFSIQRFGFYALIDLSSFITNKHITIIEIIS